MFWNLTIFFFTKKNKNCLNQFCVLTGEEIGKKVFGGMCARVSKNNREKPRYEMLMTTKNEEEMHSVFGNKNVNHDNKIARSLTAQNLSSIVKTPSGAFEKIKCNDIGERLNCTTRETEISF